MSITKFGILGDTEIRATQYSPSERSLALIKALMKIKEQIEEIAEADIVSVLFVAVINNGDSDSQTLQGVVGGPIEINSESVIKVLSDAMQVSKGGIKVED